MPLWSRYPKGTYTRPSAEWYAHQRGRCALAENFDTSGFYEIFGLFNNSSPGVYLHILGVVISAGSEGIPVFYSQIYTGQPPTAGGTSPALISSTAPLYSNDPMPPGIGVWGVDPNPIIPNAPFFIAGANPAVFYPPGEVAVLAPNDTFGVLAAPEFPAFRIMFDWYWAGD